MRKAFALILMSLARCASRGLAQTKFIDQCERQFARFACRASCQERGEHNVFLSAHIIEQQVRQGN